MTCPQKKNPTSDPIPATGVSFHLSPGGVCSTSYSVLVRGDRFDLSPNWGTPPQTASWSQRTQLPCPCWWGPQHEPHHPLSDLILGTGWVFALPPWGDLQLTPHPIHRGAPAGGSHLEVHHRLSNLIPVSEDLLTWIPRVRSHLRLHHCPSNSIWITEAPLALSP